MASKKMSQKKNSLEGPKPSFFKKIQNYIDYNNATTRIVTNPSVASKLKKALEDIVTANEDSKKKKKAAMRLQNFGKKLPKLEEERRKRIAKDKAKIKKTIKLKANMLQELKEKKEQERRCKRY